MPKGQPGSLKARDKEHALGWIARISNGVVPAGKYKVSEIFDKLTETQKVNVGRWLVEGLVSPDDIVEVKEKVDKEKVKIDKESILKKAMELISGTPVIKEEGGEPDETVENEGSEFDKLMENV